MLSNTKSYFKKGPTERSEFKDAVDMQTLFNKGSPQIFLSIIFTNKQTRGGGGDLAVFVFFR